MLMLVSYDVSTAETGDGRGRADGFLVSAPPQTHKACILDDNSG